MLREDLFYRLNVIPIHLPPLRERREDIPLLVAHFLQKFSKELGKDVRGVTPEALAVLERYHWPGNIRELENVLERAIVLGAGEMLGVDALPASIRYAGPERRGTGFRRHSRRGHGSRGDARRRSKAGISQRALERTGGVQTKAAELLRMTFRQFRYKLQKHNLAKQGRGDRGLTVLAVRLQPASRDSERHPGRPTWGVPSCSGCFSNPDVQVLPLPLPTGLSEIASGS